jgi:hypothetical protein
MEGYQLENVNVLLLQCYSDTRVSGLSTVGRFRNESGI